MQRSSRTRTKPRRGNRRPQRNGRSQSYHATRVPINPSPGDDGAFVPPTFRTSMRIAFERNSAATASLGNINFKGNDVFDPLGTAGSAQPVGFDYLALLYNRYRVIGSRIEVRAVLSHGGATGGATVSGDVCVFPSNITVNPSSLEDAISQPYARHVNVTSTTPKIVGGQMATSKITGQAGMRSTDRLTAYVSASPTEEWFWIVCFKSDFAYTDYNMNWIARITYDVEFYDRAYLGLSTLTAKAVRQAYLTKCAEQNPDNKQTSSVEQKHPEDRKGEPSIASSNSKPMLYGAVGPNGSTHAYVNTDDTDYVRVIQTPGKRAPQR